MEYNLDEYDPFKPLWLLDDYGFREELVDEPMADEDWEAWLANDEEDYIIRTYDPTILYVDRMKR